MNQLNRAKYVVLRDFEYTLPVGIDSKIVSYQKGDEINLRVNGKMAKDLIGKGHIALAAE